MEENKSEQYTFGPEEKDILAILGSFEQGLQEKLQESKGEIEKVKYYESFDINDINFKNIFITTEKDAEGKVSYHVYCGSSSNEILSIDSEGKLDVKNPDLEKYLQDIDLEKLMEENEKNPEKLKGISEKAEPEEMEKVLARKKTTDEQEEQQEEQDEETKEVEKNLEEQGEDLKISKYRKIKDSNINERMPEVFEGTEENGLAFSNKLNRFVIISKVNGHYQLNEKIEPARMTWKTITSIDESGGVSGKVPHALMTLPNTPKKAISVTLDQYGDPDIETVDVLDNQKYVGRSVAMENEGQEGEEEQEITDMFMQEGNVLLADEIAHKKAVLEKEYNVTETNIEELKELDIEALIEEEADRVKMSKEGFRGYVKSADGKTLKEKIHNAQEEIIQEYMGNRRPR